MNEIVYLCKNCHINLLCLNLQLLSLPLQCKAHSDAKCDVDTFPPDLSSLGFLS